MVFIIRDFFRKYKLIIHIFISIILAILVAKFNPWPVLSDSFVLISNIVGIIINFFVPFIILAFVTEGIISIKESSGRILFLTLALSYLFMLVFGFASCLIGINLFSIFFSENFSNFSSILEDSKRVSVFSNLPRIEVKPVLEIIPSIILSFILGLGVNATRSNTIKNLLSEFYKIINLIIMKVIVPILPIYVFGTFFKLSSSSKIIVLFKTFYKVFIVILLLHWIWLVIQFIVAGIISKKNPLVLIKNVINVYVAAFATQSSVSTIPISTAAARKNGVSDEVANFVAPLCSTIHLTGSITSITCASIAVMILSGFTVNLMILIPFVIALALMMIAAPGVPCGAILAASSLLISFLDFNPSMISLMISLHVFQDGFGTACNVCGDNAIAIIIDRIYKKTNNNV